MTSRHIWSSRLSNRLRSAYTGSQRHFWPIGVGIVAAGVCLGSLNAANPTVQPPTAIARAQSDRTAVKGHEPFDRTAQVMASVNAWIVWTDHPCGWTSEEAGGCFDSRLPNVIAVVPGMPRLYTEYVILHESAHKLQYLTGTLASDSNHECDADAQAVKWGALETGYNCPGLPRQLPAE